MSDANPNNANQIEMVSDQTGCIKQLGNSGNRVKEQIERVFETMLDSLSSSEMLFVDIATRSSQDANLYNINVKGNSNEKRQTITRISFPGKDEKEAWRFSKLMEQMIICKSDR